MAQSKYSISTYSGEFFDFNHPENFKFDIETIAHALSNICRYGGHCDSFYSVAEHSVLVSQVVPTELALCGLLHDASEAFVGDMPSPLKAMCQSYRTIEERVHKAVAKEFQIPYPHPAEVKVADKMLYKAERLVLTPNVQDSVWHVDVPVVKVEINCYTPKKAKIVFLERFKELTSGEYRAAA
jgi:hypothetical protein